jgi:hypothetical protein
VQFEYDDLAGTCAAGPSRPTAFRAPPARTGRPIRVILDLTTPLEAVTGVLTVASLAATVVLAFLAFSDTGADARREWVWAGTGALAFLAFGVAWWYSDCYYVIDGKQKKFLYHFSFLGFTSESVTAPFDQIQEIAIDAWERYTKRNKYSGYYYWVYATMVVLRNGTRIRVSNEVRDWALLVTDAKKAAETVNCSFTDEGNSTAYSIFGGWFS